MDIMDLLTDEERSILTKMGVELQTAAIIFRRRLSELEMRKVWRILVILASRTKDDHIKLALGDWLIKAEEWFGKDTVKNWLEEEKRLKAYRNYLLMRSGALLIQLQCLEHEIMVCCALLSLTDIHPSDFLSDDPKRRRYTLGQLKNALKGAQIFEPDFESHLDTFVKKRNRFIHEFWVETFIKGPESYNLSTMKKIEEFITQVSKEARELQMVFRGLCYAIGVEIARREDKLYELNSFLREVEESSKYIEAFLSVQRRYSFQHNESQESK